MGETAREAAAETKRAARELPFFRTAP